MSNFPASFDQNAVGMAAAQLGGTGGVGGNASFSTQPALASTQPALVPNSSATPTGGGAGQGGGAGVQPQLPPTFDQQLYMALDGVSDPSQLTPMQRGGINTATGNFSGPGSFDNAYYNTPQEFVSQLQGKGGGGGLM